MAVLAAVCVSPTTFGTVTFPAPLETTKFTAEPLATLVPDTGLSLMTSPAATVALDCVVTVPTVRPAPVMAVLAAVCVSPTTFGTVTPVLGGPLDTTRSTCVCRFSLLPASGSWPMTWSAATVVLNCSLIAPTFRSASTIFVFALPRFKPTNSGTVTFFPSEMTRLTFESRETNVPATGFSLIT